MSEAGNELRSADSMQTKLEPKTQTLDLASLVKGIPCAAPHPWGGMSIPAITTTHYDVGESMGGMRFLNGIFGRGMILYEWINVKDFLNISV